jgi:hypothetical protein
MSETTAQIVFLEEIIVPTYTATLRIPGQADHDSGVMAITVPG